MIIEDIRAELFSLTDEGYRDMQTRILPTLDPKSIIGVRTPQLRTLAKQVSRREDLGDFLADLPHAYFEENQLHAFVVSGMRDFATCVEAVDRFLPCVDNWATCDQMSPRVFRRHRDELIACIERWMGSDATYTIRFGVGMLMEHFLDEGFDPRHLDAVAAIDSEEYYVRMMVAWYFATALAKQEEATLPYLEERRLCPWTHNKAIQKAVESRRIAPELKDRVRELRVRA